MKSRSIIIVAVILAFVAGCTKGLYRKGVDSYERTAYDKSIHYFEKYLSKKDDPDAMRRLADSYRHINDFANAEKWYAKIVTQNNAEPIDMFHYAKVLMSMGEYDEAKRWFTQYLTKVPGDLVAKMLLASCKSVSSFMKDTTLYSVKEVEMPEIATAFAQIPYQNGIIFTADKEVFRNSEKYEWTGRSYLDMYFSRKDNSGRWLPPMLLKGNINGAFHEGPACFSKDGNTVYFTRSNMSGKKLKANSKNENNLKIYQAELIGEKWTNLFELPFNSDEYSCAHPSLSADGKTLFFVSDMPGGLGGTDIYKSVYDGSKWGSPENLGPVVNTAGNEMFPYAHRDGTFYFSSDAHNNLGGLDVFVTSYDGKKWLQVENLNYPLNSSADDFAFVLNGDDKTGYMSSNRSSKDKIYEVSKHDPLFLLSGLVTQKGNGRAIDSAIVIVENLTEKTKDFLLTDRHGLYKIKLAPGKEYKVSASKNMFFPISSVQKISTVGKKASENFVANFVLDQIVLEKPVVLENIYYDLDKWNIRPDAARELDKLVQFLIAHPGIHIMLGSHADSRAGDQYNLILTDKRAHAAVNYLVSHGISVARLSWKGYGESQLVNHCKNNVACSEEEHQKNRRTEFRVIKILVP